MEPKPSPSTDNGSPSADLETSERPDNERPSAHLEASITPNYVALSPPGEASSTPRNPSSMDRLIHCLSQAIQDNEKKASSEAGNQATNAAPAALPERSTNPSQLTTNLPELRPRPIGMPVVDPSLTNTPCPTFPHCQCPRVPTVPPAGYIPRTHPLYAVPHPHYPPQVQEYNYQHIHGYHHPHVQQYHHPGVPVMVYPEPDPTRYWNAVPEHVPGHHVNITPYPHDIHQGHAHRSTPLPAQEAGNPALLASQEAPVVPIGKEGSAPEKITEDVEQSARILVAMSTKGGSCGNADSKEVQIAGAETSSQPPIDTPETQNEDMADEPAADAGGQENIFSVSLQQLYAAGRSLKEAAEDDAGHKEGASPCASTPHDKDVEMVDGGDTEAPHPTELSSESLKGSLDPNQDVKDATVAQSPDHRKSEK